MGHARTRGLMLWVNCGGKPHEVLDRFPAPMLTLHQKLTGFRLSDLTENVRRDLSPGEFQENNQEKKRTKYSQDCHSPPMRSTTPVVAGRSRRRRRADTTMTVLSEPSL